MAETAYERFLKDPDKEEAVEVDIKNQKPLDLDQVKLKIQSELATQSEPKKPVKYLAMPDPKSVLEFYYTFNPTKGLANKIMGLESADIDTIKKFDKEHKKGWVMDTVSYIDKLEKSGRIQLTHCGPLSNTLRNNLLLIDDGMNDIISNLLWNAYSNRSLRIKDAIKTVIARNPRNYGSDCNLELFYKQKVIRLMVAASMGLTGSKEWTENYESDGGFIVVLKSGDVISFHFYDRKDFEEYLFNYSRIETGSTSKHDFGTLYECDSGHALNLCMTLRFDF